MDTHGFNAKQAAALVAAEGFGWQARKCGACKAPAQCRAVMDLVKDYQGQAGMTLALLRAWNRGFASCHHAETAATLN